jgi:FkbM family methyltransferase
MPADVEIPQSKPPGAKSFTHRLISSLPRSWVEHAAEFLRRYPLLKRLSERITSSFKDRDGVVAAGPSRGLHFNVGQSDSRFLLGTFEPALQEILASQLRPGMTFYDVGANVGFLAVLAARLVGAEGHVHCFEPLAENVDRIHHNARLNHFDQIKVHQTALAHIDSTAAFRVSERPTFGALSTSPMAVDKQVGIIQVPVCRLDSLFEKSNLPGPNVIKIDIEGSEIDFLAGAETVIQRFRPLLLIELHGTNQGVSHWLTKLDYCADVVGGGAVEDAPWAALAVATPRERLEMRTPVAEICRKFGGR